MFFWALAGMGLLLFAIVTIPPGARRSRALKRDLDRANAITAALQDRENRYQQHERALKTDPFYNEAVMRSKMHYRKPGEMEVAAGSGTTSVATIEGPRIPDFVPTPPAATSFSAQVTNWALLVMSALLLAVAFLFFDRPVSPAGVRS